MYLRAIALFGAVAIHISCGTSDFDIKLPDQLPGSDNTQGQYEGQQTGDEVTDQSVGGSNYVQPTVIGGVNNMPGMISGGMYPGVVKTASVGESVYKNASSTKNKVTSSNTPTKNTGSPQGNPNNSVTSTPNNFNVGGLLNLLSGASSGSSNPYPYYPTGSSTNYPNNDPTFSTGNGGPYYNPVDSTYIDATGKDKAYYNGTPTGSTSSGSYQGVKDYTPSYGYGGFGGAGYYSAPTYYSGGCGC